MIDPHRSEGAYRPDIDGLRAIAVTSVVACHVGLPGFEGGFVGVDVFFVISGYLITRLLLIEFQQSGRIELLDFYARRARRLLPAFILMVLVTLALGAIILLPIQKEQSRLGWSAIYATAYLSNFEFARIGSYFEPAAELQPLLHTWSLAVEEQFYLIWPLVLVGLIGMQRVTRIRFVVLSVAALIILIVASFSHSVRSASAEAHVAQAGFYLIWGRAWELGIGAALALLLPRLPSGWLLLRDVIGAIGFFAIIFAVLVYDENVPFPGLAAALPVLGTAAVIASGHRAPTGAAMLLSVRPVVFIGLISYCWYLWHWPLLALARTHAMGERIIERDVLLALLALVLAVLTYRFVERPMRNYGRGDRAGYIALALAIGGSGIVVVSSMALIVWGGDIAKLNGRIAHLIRASEDTNPLRASCNHSGTFSRLLPAANCVAPSDNRGQRVVVWGDSHADHIMPMIEEAGRKAGWAAIQRSMSGCPPTLNSVPVRGGRPRESCAMFNEHVADEIRKMDRSALGGVVLAARWTIYQDSKPIAVRDAGTRMRLHVSAAVQQPDPATSIKRGLAATLDALRALGVPVIVVAPVPELAYAAPLCLARRSQEYCSHPRADNDRYREKVQAIIQGLSAAREHVRIFDPINGLCSDDVCPAEKDGIVLYSDDDHITATAARELAPRFAQLAEWLASAGKTHASTAQPIEHPHRSP